MIRPAAADDLAALRAFLAALIETSMFLLGNLEAHGLCGYSEFYSALQPCREKSHR